MKGILLADAGGTSTSWSLLTNKEETLFRFKGEGINPVQHSETEICNSLTLVKRNLPDIEIDHIFFFGAGCIQGYNQNLVERLINKFWQSSDTHIATDLLGACIALFGDETGVACILGTGSNSCLYSERHIIKNIPPLGFILGDEGSGAALGKELLNRYFKGLLESNIAGKFKETFHPELSEYIEKIYRQPRPAAFLASFAPFILENADKTDIHDLIFSEFRKFFNRNIIQYKVDGHTSLGFVGSVAFAFQNFIREVANEFGFNDLIFLKSPIESLEKYYSQKFLYN